MPFILGEIGIDDENHLKDSIDIMMKTNGYFQILEWFPSCLNSNSKDGMEPLSTVTETLEYKTIGKTCKAIKSQITKCCSSDSFEQVLYVMKSLKLWSLNVKSIISPQYWTWAPVDNRQPHLEQCHQFLKTLLFCSIVIMEGYLEFLMESSDNNKEIDSAILEILFNLCSVRSKFGSEGIPNANQLEFFISKRLVGTNVLETFISKHLENTGKPDTDMKANCERLAIIELVKHSFPNLDPRFVQKQIFPLIETHSYSPLPESIELFRSTINQQIRTSSHQITAQIYNCSFRFRDYCRKNAVTYIKTILSEPFFKENFSTIIIGLCDYSESRLRLYNSPFEKESNFNVNFMEWKKESSSIAWDCIQVIVNEIHQSDNKQLVVNTLIPTLFEQINNIDISKLKRLLDLIEMVMMEFKSNFWAALYEQVARNDGIDYSRRYGIAMWYLELKHKLDTIKPIQARL